MITALISWPILRVVMFPILLGFASLTFVGCGTRQAEESGKIASEAIEFENQIANPTEDSPGGLVMPAESSEMKQDLVSNPRNVSSLEMPEVGDRIGRDGQSSDQGKVATVRYENWENLRAFASSTGKVTVVDLWSLACEPCLKEFPNLVKLHRNHGEQVTCLSVNLDFDGRKTRPPESYESEVSAFLQSVEALGFNSYICTTASDDVFLKEKIPSIPVVMVFSEKGELIKTFVDGGETIGFTYANSVQPFVLDLLNRKE